MNGSIKFLLIMANALDTSVMREFLVSRFSLESPTIEATSDLGEGIKQCELTQPQALIIDPKCGENSTKRMIEVAVKGHAKSVIILDDRPREGLLIEILPYVQISYLTRNMASYEFVDAIRGAVFNRERVFDTALRDRIRSSKSTWQLLPLPHGPSLTSLTSQEKVILRLLASGMSVSEIATQLGITLSTADNHKTRLMKKLDLHKVTQLTRFAIREGLIQI